MARLCSPGKVSTASLTALLLAYFAAMAGGQVVKASPQAEAMMFQGTNVATLAGLIAIVTSVNRSRGCGGRWTWSWVTLGALGANLLARAASVGVLAATGKSGTNGDAGFVRWDESAKTAGLVAVLAELYFALVPNVRFRFTLFALGLVFVVPLVLALPRLLAPPDVDAATLNAALRVSKQAYDAYDGDKDFAKRMVTAAHGEWRFVGFAGTENKTDVNTDVNVKDVRVDSWLRAGETARAHAGFAAMYAQVREAVWKAVQTSDKVTFVGHSLGGALATLAALDVTSRAPDKVVNVVTFGAPQVGDDNFVKLFDGRVNLGVRVVNPFDPVPKLLASQFAHTKGYYAVTSLTRDSTVTAHNLSTYALALSRPRWVQVGGAFAPPAYVALAALAVAAYHLLTRRQG